MTLSELVSESGASISLREGDAEVLRPSADTRRIARGDLFFCMPSERTDTHGLISEAAHRGASAAVLHGPDGVLSARQAGLPFLCPVDFEDAAWRLAHALAGYPSRSMKVIGVTGTNGKTTTAWIIRQMLDALGEPAAYLGTLGYRDQSGEMEVGNTTPFPVELANLLVRAKERGSKALAMEVSSHALAERRADGVEFDVAIFTNLTQDHLDFHETMESYAAAKRRLFTDLPASYSKAFTPVFNAQDPVGRKWLHESPTGIGFSTEPDSGLFVGVPRDVGLNSLELELQFRGETQLVRAALGGTFNVSNVLAASAGLAALSYSLPEIGVALEGVKPAPGRFEPIDTGGRPFNVIVDYAHTPDALEKLLDAVRAVRPRAEITTVFGCGGDRDRTKRPIMARIASERSRLTIVTSDNPRTEDPQAIIEEVAAGLVPGSDYKLEVDRPKAIEYSIHNAREDHVVVVAGKGHEDYQIIGTTKHHMDDREIVRGAIEQL